MLSHDMIQQYNLRVSLKKINKSEFIKYCKAGRYELIMPYYSDNMRAIVMDNFVIGFISYAVRRNDKGYVWCELDAIEIMPAYRCKHIAAYIIYYLMCTLNYDNKPIRALYGESWSRAIPFWRRLGVNFNMSNKKLEDYYKLGYSAAFTLTLKRLQKALNIC